MEAVDLNMRIEFMKPWTAELGTTFKVRIWVGGSNSSCPRACQYFQVTDLMRWATICFSELGRTVLFERCRSGSIAEPTT
jgi:hypothetical protein